MNGSADVEIVALANITTPFALVAKKQKKRGKRYALLF